MVEYAYDYHVDYVELDPAKASEEQPDFCTNEQAPHIRFTPYLQELLKEIIGDETNPIIKARKIYDFVTTKVMYSYMREYFTIECIPEYAAINLKGDCGVQALLFITPIRTDLHKTVPSHDIRYRTPSHKDRTASVQECLRYGRG